MAKVLFACLDSLAEQINAARRVFLCLDFDGTLTPLVDRPEEAELSAHVRQLLQELRHPPDVQLAIFSGRATSDVSERVGLPDVYYAGNHGLQVIGPGLVFVEPHAALLPDAGGRRRLLRFHRP